ncbi:MAG: PorT family protein [Bacteroidetes bacterium]|nr:PorT family protein [Bacteroidota bacterium]
MKQLFLTFLTFIVFSALAQDSTNTDLKRLVIGINVSPDYCYRVLKSNTVVQGASNFIKSRNETELPMLGYTVGLSAGYYFKKSFGIEIGIQYSKKGYKTGQMEIITTDHPEGGLEEISYNFNYIEIPVKAILKLGKKKIRFLCSTGIVPSICVYERTVSKSKYYDGINTTLKEEPNYIYNPFNLSIMASLGIDIQLGKRMNLKIEPNYKYGILQIINTSIAEHLWSSGINIGYYISF